MIIRYNFIVKDLVKIIVFAPESHADIVREAMGKAGAGKIGKYTYCSFTTMKNNQEILLKPFMARWKALNECTCPREEPNLGEGNVGSDHERGYVSVY
jgi:hypothetical protein